MPVPIVYGAITASAIAVTIIGGGIIYYCTLEGTYKIIETPTVKMGALAVLIFAIGYLLFARGKK
jgi:hypothetical protein